MKIEKYVATLMPSIRKDKVLEDIAVVRKELRDATIPSYAAIIGFFGKRKWTSKEMQSFAQTFARLVHGGNLVEIIGKGLDEMDKALDVAEAYITKAFNEETVSAAITYKKAGVLQYVDAIAFLTRYARRLANYMLVCETATEDSDTKLADSFAPAELAYLNGNALVFCQAFKAIAIPATAVEKAIEAMPEIVVKAAAAGVAEEIHGAKKIDAFGMGLIPAKWNLFYHVGKAFAEWQVSNYNAAKEEMQLVQMRKLYLEKILAKKPDAALQTEIQYTEGRLLNLSAKIGKMEAAYA
jgi:hypothetical protein